jgi:DNA-binding Lrp family transcriptional regulator
MQEILQYLKSNGERFESEIATGTKMSLASVKKNVEQLLAKGEIIACHSIQFRDDGKKIEGMRCRLAGYIPPAAPGRKSKPGTVS